MSKAQGSYPKDQAPDRIKALGQDLGRNFSQEVLALNMRELELESSAPT